MKSLFGETQKTIRSKLPQTPQQMTPALSHTQSSRWDQIFLSLDFLPLLSWLMGHMEAELGIVLPFFESCALLVQPQAPGYWN